MHLSKVGSQLPTYGKMQQVSPTSQQTRKDQKKEALSARHVREVAKHCFSQGILWLWRVERRRVRRCPGGGERAVGKSKSVKTGRWFGRFLEVKARKLHHVVRERSGSKNREQSRSEHTSIELRWTAFGELKSINQSLSNCRQLVKSVSQLFVAHSASHLLKYS